MKKTLALLFLVSSFALGQADSGQVKTKTNGGLSGDTANALYVAPYHGTSAPSTPLTDMIWFDTNVSPATCKRYNGSTWDACQTISVLATQADLSTFPSSPVDGQHFYDKSHNWTWVYNGTSSLWCNPFGVCTSSTITDNFTGSAITAPSSGMTIADGGAGGNATVGTHVCAVVFATSTGGETTSGTSATSAVSITASHKITFSSVPTGGSGTTQRRFYCSIAGGTTARFWVDTLNDNTSTSLTSSVLADGSMAIREPNRDYSAPLNGRWSVTNATSQTTSGGCGATGSSMICRISHAKTLNANTTTETSVVAATSISSYNTGNYTIQYRVVKCENGFGVATFLGGNCSVGALYVGTSFSSGPIKYELAGAQTVVGPLSGTSVWFGSNIFRAAVGSVTSPLTPLNALPRISSFPFYVRFVKTGNVHNSYVSKDGLNWSIQINPGNSAVNPADSTLGSVPSSVYDTWGLPIDNGNSGAAADSVVEIDSFTLVVN